MPAPCSEQKITATRWSGCIFCGGCLTGCPKYTSDSMKLHKIWSATESSICFQLFSSLFKNTEVRNRVIEVCKRAGHLTWLKSITGVTIEEPQYMYPYMWGEPDLSDEMVIICSSECSQSISLLCIVEELEGNLVTDYPKPSLYRCEQLLCGMETNW